MTTSPLTPAHLIAVIDPDSNLAGNSDPINRAKSNHPSNSRAVKAKLKELDDSWWMNSEGIMLSSMPEALEARHYPIYQQVALAHNERIYHTQSQKAIDLFNEKRRELSSQISSQITIPAKKWWQI